MRVFLILTTLFVCAAATFAQDAGTGKVETINLMGRDYTVSKDLPEEILGEYLYEGEKEPIVLSFSDFKVEDWGDGIKKIADIQ